MLRCLLITVLLGIGSAFALNSSVCSPADIRFDHSEIVLHPENNQRSQIYLLQNHSKSVFLWLNHEKVYPSASAGWGSPLKAGNWSALMVSQPRFRLACAELKEDKLENRTCEDVLAVCRVAAFSSDSDNVDNATFWISENTSYADMIKEMGLRQIVIKS